MKWIEVTVNTTHEAADAVSEGFFSMGCQGVSITDKNDVLDAMESNLFWDYVDEKLLAESSDIVKVRSFFLEEEYDSRRGALAERLDAIRENLPNCGSLEVTSALIDDADWANNWKQYYKPITVKNLRITPEWLKSPDDDAYTAVYLDPGMAFGTGEHETTKMCLSLMQESPMLGKKVYDIGCGSGILGIAAAKLGASVVMTDIDPTSVLTAQKNAEKNGVSDKVKILCADLLKGQGKDGIEEKNGGIETNFLSETKAKKADAVFANITADILIRLSKAVKDYLKDGGRIVLSGIIEGRAEDVRKAYSDAGFQFLKEETMGDWRAMMFGNAAK